MNVSDIMTKEVVAVRKDTSLREAAGFLAKFRIHGMPVVDVENKVIGIITESDFFTKDSTNIYLPTFLDFVFTKKMPANEQDKNNIDNFEQTTKVENVMTENCKTVMPNMPVKEFVDLVKETNFNTFPVADECGVLIGIVTVMDVIKLL